MTNLTKGSVTWEWTPKCQEAFERLKSCLTDAPTLHIIDVSDPTAKLEVHTVASGFAIGAVLY